MVMALPVFEYSVPLLLTFLSFFADNTEKDPAKGGNAFLQPIFKK